MTKAKTIDRVALTKQKMEAGKAFVTGLIRAEEVQKTPQGIITTATTKENSPFLRMREAMRREHPEEFKDADRYPECGGELEPWEGCKRCKKCGISLC